MEIDIYIIETNYGGKRISYATIDKAKAYREYKHYIELVNKHPDKEYFINLYKVNNEHFPSKISSYTIDGLSNFTSSDLLQYCDHEVPPVTACEIVDCVKLDEYQEKMLKRKEVYCDDRKVIRISTNDDRINLYTTIL